MLLGTSGALIWGNMLTGKEVMRGKEVVVNAGTWYNAMVHVGENF